MTKFTSGIFFTCLVCCCLSISLLLSCSSQQDIDQQKELSQISSQPQSTEQEKSTVVLLFEEPHIQSPQPAQSMPTYPIQAPDGAPAQPQPAASKQRPQVAIIIDDMGHHEHLGNDLLDLDMELTFSFLPYAPFTPQLEAKAVQKGRDILIHIPMEPKSKQWDPGKGALYIEDTHEQLVNKTLKMLDQVPSAQGANNHMGSRFTEHEDSMTAVLDLLQKKDFFFIDSFTTADSVGLIQARKMNIPATRRHIFLDNIHDPEKICLQIEKLIQLAHKVGYAVAIGHPNRATLTALTRCDRNLLKSVDIVGIRTLINSL